VRVGIFKAYFPFPNVTRNFMILFAIYAAHAGGKA
jgi:hypothetical protein